MKREKFKNTTQGEYKAIVALNANEPTLYGLYKPGDATRSRMVIIKFKSPAPPQDE